jgi:hypothetical protein
VLLHFGAVDQEASVYSSTARSSRPTWAAICLFTRSSPAYISEENTLTVRVRDETDEDWHTRGKQKRRRGGIWYTPQSGIWQTVWLESVPDAYIKRLIITPVYDDGMVEVGAEVAGKTRPTAHFQGEDYPLPARIPVPDFEPWSPEHPKLYDFTVTCGDDSVEQLFCHAQIFGGAGRDGVKRLFLNGRPYFHNGFWIRATGPTDSIPRPRTRPWSSTSSSPRIWASTCCRKHIKVEPLRWYYHCDVLGMLVWQDMPCGGGSLLPRRGLRSPGDRQST